MYACQAEHDWDPALVGACLWTCAVHTNEGSVLPLAAFIQSLLLVCVVGECSLKHTFTFRAVTKT